MGGNALGEIKVRRIDSGEHAKLSRELVLSLRAMFPSVRIEGVDFYADKADHGDIDLLIELDQLPLDWMDRVCRHFRPAASFTQKNSNSLSFEYKDVQVDLIGIAARHFDWSVRYYSFNDFGNLIGVTARDLGFRFGHDGLWCELYAPGCPTQLIGDICVTQGPGGWTRALQFLGWNPAGYEKGFRTLAEIFDYVCSGARFRPGIYSLESRSHDRRIRDRKRKTYSAFLEYLSCRSWPGAETPDRGAILRSAFLAFPEFAARHEAVWAAFVRRNAFRDRFNGQIVAQITGLDGIELGRHMEALRSTFDTEEGLLNFVLAASESDLNLLIRSPTGLRNDGICPDCRGGVES